MKFSIITPSHLLSNLPFLVELYKSIMDQSYINWEWILLFNGEFNETNIPDIFIDPRVKIFHISSENTNTGFIKNKAFNLASGDILVEVDHDDLITKDCLEELFKAFLDDSIGFVYSDCAMYDMKKEFIPYNSDYGWQHSSIMWNDAELTVPISFQPSSQSLSMIWFCPDHVRAWRKTVYQEVGGHNVDLYICDDHELLVRTYLKTKFKKIDKVLYIYRITGNNTSIDKRNAEIQIKTKEIRNQYLMALAEKDAKDKNLMLVDLGGGINKLAEYTSIDSHNADIIADLNNGIPLKDNSVGVINASHIIEHLRDPIKTMSEIHRVLVHGGWAFIEVPSTDGRGAFQDPTHVSFWNENSFLYYTDSYLAKYIRNDKIKFSEFRKDTHYPNEWLKSLDVSVVTVWLCAIKNNNRYPGLWKI